MTFGGLSSAALGRSAPLVAAVGLSGCPFVFGGPDLTNVGQRPDAADTGVDLTSDPDEPPVDVLAPLIVDLRGAPLVDEIGFSFVVADPDGDLLGGSVVLSDGDDLITLAIPVDLERFDAESWSLAAVDAADLFGCSQTYDRTWEMVVSDLAGNASPPVSVDVSLEALGTIPERAQAYDIGRITPPVMLCVDWTGYSDVESVIFEVKDTGTYQIQLGWPDTPVDADLYVAEVGAGVFASGYTVGFDYESVTVDLTEGVSYRLDLPFYGGTGSIGRVVIRPV